MVDYYRRFADAASSLRRNQIGKRTQMPCNGCVQPVDLRQYQRNAKAVTMSNFWTPLKPHR